MRYELLGEQLLDAVLQHASAPGAMELDGDDDGVLDMKSDDGDTRDTRETAAMAAAAAAAATDALGASDGASGAAGGGALERATEETLAYNQFLANTLSAVKEQVGHCKRQYFAAVEHHAQAGADFAPHRAQLSRAQHALLDAERGHSKATLAVSTYLLSELPPPVFRNAMSFLVSE